jgi:hypothetical protein
MLFEKTCCPRLSVLMHMGPTLKFTVLHNALSTQHVRVLHTSATRAFGALYVHALQIINQIRGLTVDAHGHLD